MAAGKEYPSPKLARAAQEAISFEKNPDKIKEVQKVLKIMNIVKQNLVWRNFSGILFVITIWR